MANKHVTTNENPEKKPLPLIHDVKKWSPSGLIEKLKEREYLYLDDDDIEILKKKKISGKSFLRLTEEKLEQFGLEFGPASEIAEFVKAIKGDTKATDKVQISELENKVASLEALLNNNIYEFDVIVYPSRRNGIKWTSNLENVSIEQFKEEVIAKLKPEILECEDTVFNFAVDPNGNQHLPRKDPEFRQMLHSFIMNKTPKFIVYPVTSSKGFSDYDLPEVCRLYGLQSEDQSAFPLFECQCEDLSDKGSQEVVADLIINLQLRLDNIQVAMGNERTRSEYVTPFLLAAAGLKKKQFILQFEKEVSGPNGHGPVDSMYELRANLKTVAVTEFKKGDMDKGIAQNVVQLDSVLRGRKRKLHEMQDPHPVNKVFGIVTDSLYWYFIECSLNDTGNPVFKLSEVFVMAYEKRDTEYLKPLVEKILGRIAWILEEVLKQKKSEGNKRVKTS